MIRKFLRIPIYNRNVIVYIGDTVLSAIIAVEKDYSITLSDAEYSLGRMSVIDHKSNGTEHIVIMLGNESDNSTIAHECLHAAYYILEAIGQDCPQQNHEALAYLMSFLIREIDKIKVKYAKR